MIYNLSSNNKKIQKEISDTVGKTYNFFESLKNNTGSQRLLGIGFSNDLADLFEKDNYPNNCNIELRPNGIILHFRSRLEMYGWVIPFTKMELNTAEGNWVISDGSTHMEITGTNNRPLDQKFWKRLLELSHKVS